VGTLLSP